MSMMETNTPIKTVFYWDGTQIKYVPNFHRQNTREHELHITVESRTVYSITLLLFIDMLKIRFLPVVMQQCLLFVDFSLAVQFSCFNIMITRHIRIINN